MADETEKTAALLGMDAKTLIMAAMFLIGGGATSAGTSLLGGNRIEDRVESLSKEVQELTRSVDKLATEKDRSDDHEIRLRRLEEERRVR